MSNNTTSGEAQRSKSDIDNDNSVLSYRHVSDCYAKIKKADFIWSINQTKEEQKMSNNTTSAGIGIGIGSVIAIILSWGINHSIGWAILHGILSWIYVIYYVINY